MYRAGQSVTNQLTGRATALARNTTSIMLESSPRAGFQQHLSNVQQNVTLQSPTVLDDMSSKMDQMLSMLNSTQQVLINQQAATKNLEDEVKRISQELSEVREGQQNAALEKCKSSASRERMRIPPELSVSFI